MPATDLDAELTTERDHLDASRAALRRMRERAEALYATGEQVAGDSYGAESLGRALSRRIAELADSPDTPIFFGRLHFTDSDYHVGRRHITDERGEPMVLDWRAPVSRAFYQASARDPQGVEVRRRFGFAAGPRAASAAGSASAITLTSFEDEHLLRGEELGTASQILNTEVERPRVGPMRDIVATIQPEQDELVRAGIEDSICVQGAPGTGKTAVGLHRAAYLLYQYRDRLRRPGVLILGPNRAFLHYIAAVLPALGEFEVEQSTVEELITRVAVRGEDPPATMALKHDVRMAAVLRNAIRGYVHKPTEPVVVADGSYRWRIPAEALRRVVDDVRREDLPHAVGRERVRARVLALLQRQMEARRGDSPSEAWLRRAGRSKPVAGFLDSAWPAVTPEALVFGLLSSAAALAAAAEGILDPAEQAALLWPKPPRSIGAARWSAADALLLDEAAGLVDRMPSFGHVIVDEAQDLSAMQCRAVARRCEHASLTLLGDLAQGTAPWAATDWAQTLVHLGKPAARVVPLTLGFRVPGAVLELANRLLPALAVDVPAARSLRHDGWLAVRQVSDVDSSVPAAVREALELEGSVAVIAAEGSAQRLASALDRAGIPNSGAEQQARVTVLPATLAKGLEYDHVIVVEPAEIVDAEPRGLHRLYVVLTRAVSRLAVLHTRPLPGPLSPPTAQLH